MAGIQVAYATKHGSTADADGAEEVARELTAAGLEADMAAFPAVGSLEGYDGVVLGAPLYTGFPLDLAPFVARDRDALSGMPVVAFAIGLTPAAPEPKAAQVEQVRKAPIDALSPARPATSGTGMRSAHGPGRRRPCFVGMPVLTDTYIISSSA